VTAAAGTPSDHDPSPTTTSLDQLTVVVDRGAQPPTIALAGELDPHTAPLLQAEIDGVLDTEGTDLVLDLSELGFVDSSGLRVLISAQHQLAAQGGTLVLRAPSETVRRLLEITGLVDHVTITDH
jgi:anti-sigma B factor antagonist